MATWAFRMCLLRSVSGGHGGARDGRLEVRVRTTWLRRDSHKALAWTVSSAGDVQAGARCLRVGAASVQGRER
jgi:hypothetical protein